jgi:hypothetical protein
MASGAPTTSRRCKRNTIGVRSSGHPITTLFRAATGPTPSCKATFWTFRTPTKHFAARQQERTRSWHNFGQWKCCQHIDFVLKRSLDRQALLTKVLGGHSAVLADDLVPSESPSCVCTLLIPPELPPAPSRESAPDVQFWYQADFDERHPGSTRALLLFETLRGQEWHKARLRAFTSAVHRLLATLARHGLLPPSWNQIGQREWIWLRNNLYLEYPDLRLCEGDWRLLRWCQGHYSDHRTTHYGTAEEILEQLGEKRQRPSEEGSWKYYIHLYRNIEPAVSPGAAGMVPKPKRLRRDKKSKKEKTENGIVEDVDLALTTIVATVPPFTTTSSELVATPTFATTTLGLATTAVSQVNHHSSTEATNGDDNTATGTAAKTAAGPLSASMAESHGVVAGSNAVPATDSSIANGAAAIRSDGTSGSVTKTSACTHSVHTAGSGTTSRAVATASSNRIKDAQTSHTKTKVSNICRYSQIRTN